MSKAYTILLVYFAAKLSIGKAGTYKVYNVKGFLKQVNNDSLTERKCWGEETTYKVLTENAGQTTFDGMCKNDEKFYQVCGDLQIQNYKTKAWILDDEVNLCGYYICKKKSFIKTTYEAGVNTNRICNCQESCLNTKVNYRGCENDNAMNCSIQSWYNKVAKCDGYRDCIYGKDEYDCEHQFGVSCQSNNVSLWVQPIDLCKSESRCDNQEDNNTATTCSRSIGTCTAVSHSGINLTREYYESQRCQKASATFRFHLVCLDGMNLINCTNSDVVFTCKHVNTSETITLTDAALCRSYDLCADGINNLCQFDPPKSLHRHFICDGNEDLKNEVEDAKCKLLETSITCKRRIRSRNNDRELPILKNWVLDGIQDCEDGKDEDASLWRPCKIQNHEEKNWIPRHQKCELRFNCRNKNTAIPLETMCKTNVDATCQLSNDVCAIAYDQANLTLEAVTLNETVKVIARHYPGILKDTSSYTTHILHESYGTEPIKILVEKNIDFNCTDLYGEVYVYIACLGLCATPTPCPLHRTKIHHSNSCPFLKGHDRIMTLTKANNLTFVEKIKIRGEDNLTMEDRFINKEIYQCDNGNCIPYYDVCNLIDNCGDGSDEEFCENNFHCKKTGRYISKKMLCDGVKHCDQGEDECSSSCSSGALKSIIPKVWLQVVAWIIGIPATIVNLMVIVKNIRNLAVVSNHTKINFFMTVLVTIIATGDLLVGIYLIGISIENLSWNNFCNNEWEWLTSGKCSSYGILSTVGSQVSLFSMTVLSVYRAYILRQFIPNKNVDRSFYLKTLGVTAVIVITSLLIALLPVNKRLELEYFFNGYYVDELPFIARPRKLPEIRAILEGYYNNISLIENADVHQVKDLIDNMIAKPQLQDGIDFSPRIEFRVLGFYGSSGSCIFKYFVNTDDSQYHYSMILIVVNFSCFLVISASYLMVNAITMRSASKVGKGNIGQLQRKISFIIGTDFLCWFPFIIVCLLHFYRVFDATKFYPEFSVLILPINSLVNPLLYDSNNFFVKMPKKVGSVARQCRHQINSWSRKALNMAVMELRGETDQQSVAASTHITTAGPKPSVCEL